MTDVNVEETSAQTAENSEPTEGTEKKQRAERKPSPYKIFTIRVHKDVDGDTADPASVMDALSKARGYVAGVSIGAKTGITVVTVDTKESAAQTKRGRQPSLLKKDQRAEILKLYESAMTDPSRAAKIAQALARASEGHDTAAELVAALGYTGEV